MSQDGRVFAGQTLTLACDRDTNPSYLPDGFLSTSVNRAFRSATNATRPPFIELDIQLAFGQDEKILADFKSGNFQGALQYTAVSSIGKDGIICSVAGVIYYISIINGIGYLHKLIEGNDPSMMHTWFVQAENWVYIQNGYQNPIAWNGDLSGTPTNLQAKGNGSETIYLTWINNSLGAVKNEIQFKYGETGFLPLASISYSEEKYTFVASSSSVSYSFQVRSVYPDGSSTPWSNIATTTAANTTKTTETPNSIFRLNPIKNQMPIGTIMAYAYGRVAVSDANNNIYISDIIYGNGFTDTANTQNFTEQTYWAEGGSFTPPANLGLITGMRVMSSLNINVRGQGELVIFCERGSFTLDLSQPRSTWQTNNIQKVSLIGRGCRSPWSVTGINNETYFRSDDGWALYNNSQVDFSNGLGFRKISREMNYWVNQDTGWMRQFASGMFFDNRIIATVSPFTVSTGSPSVVGLHRPHRAMIVLDVDRVAQDAPSAGLPFRWDGLWEGPQPTQLITAQINSVQRAFVFSFDQDNVNRIYELQQGGRDDYSIDLGNVKIKSFFTTKRHTWSEKSSPFIRKQIIGGDIWISNFAEHINVSAQFKPDNYPCYFPLLERVGQGFDYCTPLAPDCMPIVNLPTYNQIKFTSPDEVPCEAEVGIPVTEAAEFQIKVQLEGTATVDRYRVAANLNNNLDLPQGTCPIDEIEGPNPVDCCPVNDLNYYRIVELKTFQ